MNLTVFVVLLLAFAVCMGPGGLMAQTPRDVEPTDDQFRAAQQAAKALGGQFVKYTYPESNRTVYILHMPHPRRPGRCRAWQRSERTGGPWGNCITKARNAKTRQLALAVGRPVTALPEGKAF
jgi:hypothetical protein